MRFIAVVLALLLPGVAWAEPTPAELKEASSLYEQGEAAHRRGDHLAAAKAFARADELVPDASALAAALVAVLETDEAVLAMQLAGRTTRAPYENKHIALADKVRARFNNTVGRIVVHCTTCTVQINGAPAERGVAAWVIAGAHRVDIDVDGRVENRDVTVEPTSIVTILPLATPIPRAPVPEQPDDPTPVDVSGPSPVWFWVALGVTGAVGVGAIVSAVHTDMLHDDFVQAPTHETASDGEAAEVRTNVLYGLSGGLAILTTIIGVFVVDWSSNATSSWQLTPDGVRLTF